MNIRYQRRIIDIEFVESISRGLNRYRIINIVLYWLISISVNTIPHFFRGKIPREGAADSRPDNRTGSRLFEINMWMWRYGRTFPRQISVDQAVELEFRKKRVQESRDQGSWRWDSSAPARCSLGNLKGSFRRLPLRSEWHWVNAISYTISIQIFSDINFDIEREKDLRYRIRYQHAISINV